MKNLLIILSSLFFFSVSQATDIIIAPGSSIKVAPEEETRVVCEKERAASNRCKIKTSNSIYYVLNQDGSPIEALYESNGKKLQDAINLIKHLIKDRICD